MTDAAAAAAAAVGAEIDLDHREQTEEPACRPAETGEGGKVAYSCKSVVDGRTWDRDRGGGTHETHAVVVRQ